MANMQGSLAETKEILRSLVISSPQTITIHELNRDFRNSEGYPIPYGKLGFSNLELFLRSLADTLYVDGNGNVRALESSKSKHIVQMVAKQKSATRARKNELEFRQSNSHHARQQNNNYYNSQNNMRSPIFQHTPHTLQQQQYSQAVNNQIAYNYLTNICAPAQMSAMQRIHQLQYPMMNLPPQLVNRNLLSRPTFFPQPLHSLNQNRTNNYRQNRTEIPPPNSNKINIISPEKTNGLPEIIEISSPSTNEETSFNGKVPLEEDECTIINSGEEKINEAMHRLKLGTQPKYNPEVAENESDAALPELSDYDPIFQINMPSNVVPYGQTIKRASITTDIIKGAKFSIYVSEVR